MPMFRFRNNDVRFMCKCCSGKCSLEDCYKTKCKETDPEEIKPSIINIKEIEDNDYGLVWSFGANRCRAFNNLIGKSSTDDGVS